ncbi:hypothetical protein [Rhodococcus triatomae]
MVVIASQRPWVRSIFVILAAVIGIMVTPPSAGAQQADSTTQSETAPDSAGTESDGQQTTPRGIDSTLGAVVCGVAGPIADIATRGVEMFTPGDQSGIQTNCVSETVGAAVDGVQAVGGKIKDGAESVAKGAIESAALSFGNAGAAILKFALGWWITINPLDETVFTDTVAAIGEYTFYIQVAAFALSMILLGARLAMARSGSIRDTSEEGFRQMARATLVAGMFTTLVIVGTRLSDSLANWFMDGTVGSDPTGLVEAMVSISLYGGSGGMALLFVIGLLGILGGLVMAFLMLMRTGFLVLMAAALPIAGAAGGTKVGSQAFDKMIAWTIAWLLVKPVGAFVIGCSAMLFLKATPTITDPEQGDAMMALTGVILLCAAALVLPALMRMIVPNVGALGGGGSGAAAGAAAGALAMKGASLAAGGGAPSGAAAATSSSSAANAGAATSATPPTGAPSSPGPSAPADFGSNGGQQPGGNGGGTPVGSTAGPAGSESGTPSDSGATPAAGHDDRGEPVAMGAAPQFSSGGFEK